MKEFIISKNDAGQRLDKFIAKAVPSLPKSLVYKYLRLKRIKVDGARAQQSDILKVGSRITLYINDEFFSDDENYDFTGIVPNINIVYEDENIIIVDKHAGVICHADNSEKRNTLINHILSYLYLKGFYDPKTENSFAPALCNRIDRNTSGLVIAAKNAQSHRIICEKIKNREIKKVYRCITVGVPEKKKGVIDNYLYKNTAQNRVYVHETKIPGSKQAVTLYNVKERKGELSLLEVTLVTGRTHQIRAHLSFIGLPLLGDGKYGKNAVNLRYNKHRQELQSYSLKFEFSGDAGILGYLNGREFRCKTPLALS